MLSVRKYNEYLNFPSEEVKNNKEYILSPLDFNEVFYIVNLIELMLNITDKKGINDENEQEFIDFVKEKSKYTYEYFYNLKKENFFKIKENKEVYNNLINNCSPEQIKQGMDHLDKVINKSLKEHFLLRIDTIKIFHEKFKDEGFELLFEKIEDIYNYLLKK